MTKRFTAAEKAEAEALWAKLDGLLADVEGVILEIIAKRAWEPVGYRSFVQAWNERLKCRLATHAMKAAVVYALLDSDMSIDEIAETTKIDPEIVDHLAKQEAEGVPVSYARAVRKKIVTPSPGKSVVSEHERTKRGPAQTIHVTVSAEEYRHWGELSAVAGSTLVEQAELAIRAHFENLGKPKRGRRAA